MDAAVNVGKKMTTEYLRNVLRSVGVLVMPAIKAPAG